MKKTPRKLVLRNETLRTLTDMALMRAIGGYDTGAKACESQVAFDSGPKNCEAPAAVIATVACR
jgi:hypothetical protein